MAIVADTRPVSSRQEIYEWLIKEAEQLGIQVNLITHGATMSDGRLYLRVYIGNAADAYDEASKLQQLEGSWNYQESDPQPHIFLLPADESDQPESAEAYVPIQQAVDRCCEAFHALRVAKSPEEAQKALKEMESAKTAELKAANQLNHAV